MGLAMVRHSIRRVILVCCIVVVFVLVRRSLRMKPQVKLMKAISKAAPIRLSPADIKVFSLKEADLPAEFKAWDPKATPLSHFLWKNYGVVAVPQAPSASTDFELFRKSILRHIAMFYGDYLRSGGDQPRHFGLPKVRCFVVVHPSKPGSARSALR